MNINFYKMIIFVLACVAVPNFAAYAEERKDRSRFLKELDTSHYAETKAPEAAPVFRWDFSKKGVQTYSYEQEVVNKMDISLGEGDEPEPEQTMSAKGFLLINSQADGTAEFILKDVKSAMKVALNKTDEPKAMEQEMSPFVVQGMKEDGTGPFGDSSQDMMLKLMFPLPPKSLKVGESVDVPAQLPFNAMGSQLQVKGKSRITLTRYVLVGSHTCAEFSVDTDISDLKVPAALAGSYSCSATGSALFYFDTSNRKFVSGSTAMLMQFSIDAPTPKINVPGETTPDMPSRTKMSMKSDNFIHVSLQE